MVRLGLGLGLWHGTHLAHRSQEVVLGPLLYHLAALVKAVYLDARELHPVASGRNPKELSLVGSACLPACDHLIPFGQLVLYGVVKVGHSVAEVLYLSL